MYSAATLAASSRFCTGTGAFIVADSRLRVYTINGTKLIRPSYARKKWLSLGWLSWAHLLLTPKRWINRPDKLLRVSDQAPIPTASGSGYTTCRADRFRVDLMLKPHMRMRTAMPTQDSSSSGPPSSNGPLGPGELIGRNSTWWRGDTT